MASRASKLFQAFGAAQDLEAAGEAVQVLAFDGVDDANALQRDVEILGGDGDAVAIAQEDGRAEAEGVELARRLEHPRVGALGEDHPFLVPLELVDDTGDESHGG